MRLGFLHTAAIHEATFTALTQSAAPDAVQTHLIREDLLAEARSGADVSETLRSALDALADCDAVLCTCSTLGPLAESHGALRIDRPLAQAAAGYEGGALIAYCLDSTRAPTEALLCEEGLTDAQFVQPDAWPHFEAGDQEAFADAIAKAIRSAHDGSACIVLAQASMAVAAPLLDDLGPPVLTSPPLAVAALTAKARKFSK